MTTPAPSCRIMHFSDTHFGVETYGRIDPATGMHTRLLDFKRSLMRGIEIALDRGIHLAVFTGDAYKGRDPSQTHQREFADCIRALTERGIPVVMLTGNHDIPNVRGRAHAMEIYRTLGVEGVHILHQPVVKPIETRAGTVQIAAMPYLMKGFQFAREELQGKSPEEIRAHMEERYAAYIDRLAADCDPDLPTLLLGHFWVADARLSDWQKGYFSVNEPRVQLSWVARSEFDYVAMGHIHRHQNMNRRKNPPVVYVGSPYRMDFGETDEPKGFVIVDLVRGSTQFEFVEMPGFRPLIDIDVSADNESPTETILAAIASHSLRDAVVRLTYHTSEERAPLVREREIREALSPAFLVVAIRREVRREASIRSKALTESLDPGSALGHWLDLQEGIEDDRKQELRSYAVPLIEELTRQEALV